MPVDRRVRKKSRCCGDGEDAVAPSLQNSINQWTSVATAQGAPSATELCSSRCLEHQCPALQFKGARGLATIACELSGVCIRQEDGESGLCRQDATVASWVDALMLGGRGKKTRKGVLE